MGTTEALARIAAEVERAKRIVTAAQGIGLDATAEQEELAEYTTSYAAVLAAKSAGRSVTLSGRGGWYVGAVA